MSRNHHVYVVHEFLVFLLSFSFQYRIAFCATLLECVADSSPDSSMSSGSSLRGKKAGLVLQVDVYFVAGWNITFPLKKDTSYSSLESGKGSFSTAVIHRTVPENLAMFLSG